MLTKTQREYEVLLWLNHSKSGLSDLGPPDRAQGIAIGRALTDFVPFFSGAVWRRLVLEPPCSFSRNQRVAHVGLTLSMAGQRYGDCSMIFLTTNGRAMLIELLMRSFQWRRLPLDETVHVIASTDR